MTLPAALAAALTALWAVSRLTAWAIERAWPELGQCLAIDASPIHVLDVPGPPGAATLLLIHGASGNLREPLAALRDVLGGRFRLVAVDRPGHGHSGRGSSRAARLAASDPGVQADILAEVLRRLDTGPALVMGHSWGAAVAAAIAVRHPGAVRGLILVAPASHPWPGGISARSRFFAKAILGRMTAGLIAVPAGLFIAPLAIRAVFAPGRPPKAYARRTGTLLAIRPKTLVANSRDVADLRGHLLRLSARYDTIRAPTAILTGERDPVVSPAIHAFGLARDIPGARLTVIPGAGHMLHWTHGDAVAAAIDRVSEVAAAKPAARLVGLTASPRRGQVAP